MNKKANTGMLVGLILMLIAVVITIFFIRGTSTSSIRSVDMFLNDDLGIEDLIGLTSDGKTFEQMLDLQKSQIAILPNGTVEYLDYVLIELFDYQFTKKTISNSLDNDAEVQITEDLANSEINVIDGSLDVYIEENTLLRGEFHEILSYRTFMIKHYVETGKLSLEDVMNLEKQMESIHFVFKYVSMPTGRSGINVLILNENDPFTTSPKPFFYARFDQQSYAYLEAKELCVLPKNKNDVRSLSIYNAIIGKNSIQYLTNLEDNYLGAFYMSFKKGNKDLPFETYITYYTDKKEKEPVYLKNSNLVVYSNKHIDCILPFDLIATKGGKCTFNLAEQTFCYETSASGLFSTSRRMCTGDQVCKLYNDFNVNILYRTITI